MVAMGGGVLGMFRSSKWLWAKISSVSRIVIGLALASLLESTITYGAVSIGLSGFGASTRWDLEKRLTTRGSASLSFGLGPFLSLGVAASRATTKSEGIQEISGQYYEFKGRLEELKYDLRGTIILYRGLVSPYLFGGIANRYVTKVDYFPSVEQEFRLDHKDLQTPTYGFGIAVNLNRNFSLKVTQTYTHVTAKILVVDETLPSQRSKKDQRSIDSYTQVGINYNFM